MSRFELELRWMRQIIAILLAVIMVLLIVQIYNLNSKKAFLKTNLSKVNDQVENLEKENRNLQADLEYFTDPLNLAKELKSKFNYKRPGEKLIIVVPRQ